MSIEKALAKWAKTPNGRKALKAAKNEQTLNAGTTGGIGGRSGKASVEDIAYGVVTMFQSEIEAAGFEYGDYLEIVGASAKMIDGEVVWQVDIQFDRSKISRDSWYSEGYPGGAYDIVQLMNNGYAADGYVYLVEEGADGKKNYRRSLRAREGSRFMNEAEWKVNAHGETGGYWVEIHPRFYGSP